MAPDYPDVVTLAVPLFVGGILLEMAIAWRSDAVRFELRDTMCSLAMGVGNIVVGILIGFVSFGAAMWAYELSPLRLGTSWPIVVLAFVLDDFRYYWWHRFSHEIRWMWASHVNHHSSQHYNLSTALRQPWSSTFSLGFLLALPLAALGFHPALLAFVGGINLIYQYWIHTEAIGRMPRWFEAVFNTPSHHRVHHATNPRYLDANYAGVFIVWDRMFGTFVPERDEDPCRYGIVKNLGTFNPLRVAFHEWLGIFRDLGRPGLSLRQRLGYALARPGYSHDGSRKSSLDLKADYVGRHPDQAGLPGLPDQVPERLGGEPG